MAVEETTIARPYAEAVFRLASESDSLESWSAILTWLSAVVGDEQMASAIRNPKFSRDLQLELLMDVCEDKLNDSSRNFLKLLADNQRLIFIPAIAELFDKLKSEAGGVVDVVVSSAYVVKAAEEKELAEALKKRLGKEIRITTEKDASLIGGVRIRAGDMVIDGSIEGRLRQLATEFGI